MRGSLLLQALLLQLTDVLLVESKLRTNPTGNNQVEAQAVGMADWAAFSTPKGPHFAPDTPTCVTAAVGAPAHVPCKARNLGSKSVSWIRHRDLHVLTVSSFTFTNDERFSAHRDPATGDWVLVLRRPLPSDSGFYECSISTKPVTTISVKLDVVVPTAELLGDGEVYLDRGSTLNLTCVVHFSPTPPEFILWYHRDKLVNYGSREGREIKVATVHKGDTTRSSLLVHNATVWDSGRYSCKPSNAQKISIDVHVLKSETPAAMQTTTSSAPPAAASHLLSQVFVTAFCVLAAAAHTPDVASLLIFISSGRPFPLFTLFTNR
ncbi:fibroblast growth factor receptor 1 [Procambarus clarkii]|uniref:fibroblast growth factor receptor 1 n=1 Tax=Procambarus clarkii TaxID=6728 RepID=UPI001E67065D|nr:hemicentin-2-like [Procambarus clarkii]